MVRSTNMLPVFNKVSKDYKVLFYELKHIVFTVLGIRKQVGVLNSTTVAEQSALCDGGSFETHQCQQSPCYRSS